MVGVIAGGNGVKLPALTPTERRIALLVMMGLSNRAICERLMLEHNSLRWYLKSIYQKYNLDEVKDKREALTMSFYLYVDYVILEG